MRASSALAAVALAALAAASSSGCKLLAKKKAPATLSFDKTYTVGTKLATLHFPEGFVASQPSPHMAALAPLALSGFDDADELYFVTNDKTVTNVLDEYVRVLHGPLIKSKPDWKEKSRVATNCFKDKQGLLVVAGFTGKTGKPLTFTSCTFFEGGHGYSFSTIVADRAGASEAALVKRIVDATDVTP